MVQKTDKNATPSWTAAAVAKAGQFTIEVDEALSGPPSWQVSLDSPVLFFSFRLADIGALLSIRQVLELNQGANGLKTFELSQLPFHLKIHRDELKSERYIVHLTAPSHDLRFVLSQDDVKQIDTALDDVIEQLELQDAWTTTPIP